MDSKRSDGVLVLGVIAIVFGVWSLLHYFGSELLILKDPQLFSQMSQTRGSKAAQLAYFQSISSLFIYVLFIVGGLAILRMKNWARILLIIVSGIQFALFLILPYIATTIMSDEYHKAWFLPTPIPILYVINIWFLNKKRIREQFLRREHRPQTKTVLK